VSQVERAALGAPLWIGGGVTAENVAEALAVADGVIVSTALKQISSWATDALDSDWDVEKVRALVAASHAA
jgi:predicted TIM-barrel enzyme